jgi:hypothetical protein
MTFFFITRTNLDNYSLLKVTSLTKLPLEKEKTNYSFLFKRKYTSQTIQKKQTSSLK